MISLSGHKNSLLQIVGRSQLTIFMYDPMNFWVLLRKRQHVEYSIEKRAFLSVQVRQHGLSICRRKHHITKSFVYFFKWTLKMEIMIYFIIHKNSLPCLICFQLAHSINVLILCLETQGIYKKNCNWQCYLLPILPCRIHYIYLYLWLRQFIYLFSETGTNIYHLNLIERR